MVIMCFLRERINPGVTSYPLRYFVAGSPPGPSWEILTRKRFALFLARLCRTALISLVGRLAPRMQTKKKSTRTRGRTATFLRFCLGGRAAVAFYKISCFLKSDKTSKTSCWLSHLVRYTHAQQEFFFFFFLQDFVGLKSRHCASGSRNYFSLLFLGSFRRRRRR